MNIANCEFVIFKFIFSVLFQITTFGMSPFLPEMAMPFPGLVNDSSCKRGLFNKHRKWSEGGESKALYNAHSDLNDPG